MLSEHLATVLSLDGPPDALVDALTSHALKQTIDRALFGEDPVALRRVIGQRLSVFRDVALPFGEVAKRLELESLGYSDLWDVYLPLAQHLMKERDGIRECFVVGIVGGPGCGKTTIATVLELILSTGYHVRTLRLSSDDFYIPRAARCALGHQWRGPDTLDTDLTRKVFAAMRAQERLMDVPRYDLGLDDRVSGERVEGPFSICLFEGWMAGKCIADAFGTIRNIMHYLMFVDAPILAMKASRLKREASVRSSSAGKKGLSDEEMSSFWRNVIEPGMIKFTLPYRAHADLIIKTAEVHRWTDIQLSSREPCSEAARDADLNERSIG